MQIYLEGIKVAFRGAPMTLGVCLCALLIGIVFGLIFALMRTSRNRVLVILAKIYIEVVRGTPLIVQALIMAYGLPVFLQQNGIAFSWREYMVVPAIIVCGLNSAAYMAEVIRGGIQSVDKGQIEAAHSLGMTKKQVMKLVVLPQAFKVAIPAFGNEFVTLIKETAVLSFVAVVEILRSAQLWNASTFETFAVYTGAAVVYLCFTFPLSKVVAYIEKKLSWEGAI